MFYERAFLTVILKKELAGRHKITFSTLQILTKDSVTVSVDGVVYYRVQNATLAVANITNADSATRLLAQTTLRNVLGTKNLSQILSDREEIAHNMQVRRAARWKPRTEAETRRLFENLPTEVGGALAFLPSRKGFPELDGRGCFPHR